MTFWWRRWSVHSRSPRWITPPCASADDLHLDVARTVDQTLEKQRVVSERRRRHAAGGREGVAQLTRRAHDLHSLAAAARGRLDQQREARVVGR